METHFERMKGERDAKEHELAAAASKHNTAVEALRKHLDKAVAERRGAASPCTPPVHSSPLSHVFHSHSSIHSSSLDLEL